MHECTIGGEEWAAIRTGGTCKFVWGAQWDICLNHVSCGNDVRLGTTLRRWLGIFSAQNRSKFPNEGRPVLAFPVNVQPPSRRAADGTFHVSLHKRESTVKAATTLPSS